MVKIGLATLYHGDNLELIPTLADESIDAIVVDPPYGLAFMGKTWDKLAAGQHDSDGKRMQAWHERWLKEAFRVLKPGGYLAAFGSTRTYHRLACAAEDVGFEVKESLSWCFGAGFPKAADASKLIDQHLGKRDEREVIGDNGNGRPNRVGKHSIALAQAQTQGGTITQAATPEAQAWEGWKSALKPAHELILLARKPLIGTIAENLLAYGTGALHIEACRVETGDSWTLSAAGGLPSGQSGIYGTRQRIEQGATGRFPPNVLLDGSEVVVATFPQSGPSGWRKEHTGKTEFGQSAGWNAHQNKLSECAAYADSGSAARYFPHLPLDDEDFVPWFYCGKASRVDRDEGCEGLEVKRAGVMTCAIDLSFPTGAGNPRTTTHANHHVSVKPVSLMKWLVRLLTPPNGIVLDPFMGSGSTLKAATLEGFASIGMELDADYFEIALARVRHAVETAAKSKKQPELNL